MRRMLGASASSFPFPSRRLGLTASLSATSKPAVQASMDPPAPGKAAAAVKTTPSTPPPPGTTKAAKATTLLDVHEVEWITRELERLLAREHGGGGFADAGAEGHHRRKRAKVSPAPKKQGFLAELLGRHAVSICSGDAVDATTRATAAGRRQRGRRSFREVDKV
ncbi:hypothetical protein ACP70R_026257 [Stipagrostis hirtigluma subsp. patula]